MWQAEGSDSRIVHGKIYFMPSSGILALFFGSISSEIGIRILHVNYVLTDMRLSEILSGHRVICSFKQTVDQYLINCTLRFGSGFLFFYKNRMQMNITNSPYHNLSQPLYMGVLSLFYILFEGI